MGKRRVLNPNFMNRNFVINFPQVLRLDPSTELTFYGNNEYGKGDFSEFVTSKLRISSISSDRIVYFKIKTTAPELFSFGPDSGVIKPRRSAEISILLLPVDGISILEREGAKHKFVIQSAFGSNETIPVGFWNSISSSNVMESKLQAIFTTSASGSTTPAANLFLKNPMIPNLLKRPQVLRLDPSMELTFNGNNGYGKGAFTEVVTSKLRLDNPSDRIVYFKVKTTAPKHYCVRPNSGVIKPGHSAEISVLLQPVDDPSILEREGAKHKFMIQSAFGSDETIPVDEFWKSISSSDVMDSKLRVVFNTSASGGTTPAANVVPASAAIPSKQPPSPTPAASTKKDYTTAYENAGFGEKNDTTELRRRHDAEKQKLETDNRKLQDQLNLLRQQLQSTAIASEGGFPTIHVVLLAVAMFLIGVILGKMI
jgi:hypothetical protein